MKDKIIEKGNEFILKEAEDIYGLDKCMPTLKNYATYLTLRKEEKIDFGTFNVLICNDSEYDSAERLVGILAKLLQTNGIIQTSYHYLSREEIRGRNEQKQKQIIPEEMLIIDSKRNENSIRYMIKDIKEMMKLYPEKVFVLVEDDKARGLINANIGDILTWTLEIEKVSKENKIHYIQNFLRDNNIRLEENCKLTKKLSEEPYWKVKNEMVNLLLECKSKNIEQISDSVLEKQLGRLEYKKQEKSGKTGLEELDALIGMEEVKRQIKQILNFVTVNQKREELPMLHMSFLGNPGTGKTTVARIVGKIFSDMKLLSDQENFLEVERADLIAEYVGQTAPKTKAVLEEADGGVLFIDEAYTLASYIKDEGGRDYAQECIATLIKGMEDKRNSLCVILAGYTKEMQQLLKVNPGFASRIQFQINFPDYDEEMLYHIFKQMAQKEKYKLSPQTKEILLSHFRQEKQKENFANARYVRNLFEKIKFEQADRVVETKEDINKIRKVDIQKVLDKLEKQEEKPVQQKQNKIGFECKAG